MINAAEKIKEITADSRISHGNYIIKQYIRNYELLIMVIPGLIALLLFNYMPMYGVLIAFKDFKIVKGIWGSPWVGFEHFATLFFGQDFPMILRNTVVISLLKLACGFPAPIVLALLLNEVRNQGYKKVVQTLTYLPHFFSWVVLGGIITMLFSYNGPVNILLKMMGMKNSIMFFGDNYMFLTLIIVTAVWQSVGWGAVIYIAALSGVDETLYEAAYMDGANRWKQTIYISIPCLIPTITTVFILNLGQVLNAGFDQIYNLYNPTVYAVSDIIDTYVLRKLRAMDYEIGTAVGLFKSAVGLVFLLGANWLAKKISDNELGIM